MKKIIFSILAFCLIICCFTACNGKDEKQPNTTNEEENTMNDINAGESTTKEPEDIDGNPYSTHEVIDGETYIYYDYSEAYDKLDLSQYTNHGYFSDEGIMWVEKAHYTGKQFAYIDYNGNIVIPFTDGLEAVEDFENGLATIIYELDFFGNGQCGIINLEGEVVGKYEMHPSSKRKFLSNGNIYYSTIEPHDFSYNSYEFAGDSYMFCKETSEFVKMPVPAKNTIESIDFSNELLMVFSEFGDEWGAKYFDSKGNCVIDFNKSTNFYNGVVYAGDFVDGEAKIVFVGNDRNKYSVVIDKEENWLTEPVLTDSDIYFY
mgnify:CR=1 FL=1